MRNVPELAQQISHVAGLDSAHTSPAHGRDPGDPVDCHESHADWQPPIEGQDPARARWLECPACGVRDYYPGAELPCQALSAPQRGRRPERPATLAEALERLRADLDAFAAWWRARPSLGDSRPSLEEWRAEYLEWARGPKP